MTRGQGPSLARGRPNTLPSSGRLPPHSLRSSIAAAPGISSGGSGGRRTDPASLATEGPGMYCRLSRGPP